MTYPHLQILIWTLMLCAGRAMAQPHEHSLVILVTEKGSGSGFVVEMDGKTYVATNLHILEGGLPKIHTMGGLELERGEVLRVAKERDLALIEVNHADVHPLPLAAASPRIDETIVLYGNSDGGGVVTRIGGKILGVGPALIEVDAAFVQGNSGSPILNAAGEVLGVASFAVLNNENRNWIKTGTRYNHVRRFGYRMHNSEWTEMTWNDFGRRLRMLEDFELFVLDMFKLLYTPEFRNPEGLFAYQADAQRENYRFYRHFPDWIQAYSRALNLKVREHGQRRLDLNQVRVREQKRTREIANLLSIQAGRPVHVHGLEVFSQRNRPLSTLLMDQEYLDALPETRQLKQRAHQNMVHDQWGNEILRQRALMLYNTFDRILQGTLLE